MIKKQGKKLFNILRLDRILKNVKRLVKDTLMTRFDE